MILTDKGMEQVIHGERLGDAHILDATRWAIETWRAYADIVQRVAESDWQRWFVDGDGESRTRCRYCGKCPWYRDGTPDEHESDCLYIATRKLRGLE